MLGCRNWALVVASVHCQSALTQKVIGLRPTVVATDNSVDSHVQMG